MLKLFIMEERFNMIHLLFIYTAIIFFYFLLLTYPYCISNLNGKLLNIEYPPPRDDWRGSDDKIRIIK